MQKINIKQSSKRVDILVQVPKNTSKMSETSPEFTHASAIDNCIY